jgi:DNA-binding response OmpR family regulator
VSHLELLHSEGSFHAVAIDRKHVLAACLDDETIAKLDPAFSRTEFEVNRVGALHHATKLVRHIRFDLILIGFAVRGEELDALFDAIRQPESPNVTSRVALLAAPEELVEARQRRELGAAKALATSLPPLELQEAVTNLLRSRARLHIRVLTRVSARLTNGSATQLLCQTRDMSRSGLLVITDNRFPVGSSLAFVLDLPDAGGRIHGEAEVVRHALESREGVDGLGLRFQSFAADGERRLVAFLERHQS